MLIALACCALTACGLSSGPGPVATHTVTVRPSQASATPGTGTTSTTPPASTAPTSAAGPGRCRSSTLHATLGSSQAAAGTFYQVVILTNTSAAACTLFGYPGVSFVTGPGGSQVGAAANRNPNVPAALVTLPPGGEANALIALTDAGVYPPSGCQPTSVTWLRVYPPGAFSSVYVHYSAQTCALPTKVMMTVTAVRLGAGNAGP